MSTQSSRKWEIYTYFMKILMTFWRETLETFHVTWITVGLWKKIVFHSCIIRGSICPGFSVMDSLMMWYTPSQIVRKTLFLNVTFCIAWKREPWARVCYWTVSQLLLNVWLMIFISCAGTFWYRIRSLTNLTDLETKSILFCSLAKQYVWWCRQCCGYELWHAP